MVPARILTPSQSAVETETFAGQTPNAQAVLDQLQAALESPFVPAADFSAALENASQLASRLRKTHPGDPLVRTLLAAALHVWGSAHFQRRSVPASVRSSFAARQEAGWPGLLGAMLLSPAWQLSETPTLDRVPDWFWPEYTAWLFMPPLGFSTAGEAETYAAHYLRHVEPLARWAVRNYGSAAVRGAVTSYLNLASFSPLYLSSSDLSRHSLHHGQIMARVFTLPNEIAPVSIRAGRPLRIGFVLDEADADGATASGPALFRHLDPLRFEVSTFITPTASGFSEQLPEARVLPESLAEQLTLLNSAMLDVLVFASDVAGTRRPLAQLACQRIAPLQIATSASQITTGFSSIDVFLTGLNAVDSPIAATENFIERVAVMPSAVRTYVPGELPSSEGVENLRAALQIPDGQTTFATFLRIGQLAGSTLDCWARLLRDQPGASLLIQLIADPVSTSAEAERVRLLLSDRLDSAALSRVHLLDQPVYNQIDLLRVLNAANVFIEPALGGNPDLLVLPLAAGVPVIAWEGAHLRTRFAPALLRSLGFPELIAHDADRFATIAASLASAPAERATLGENLKTQMQRTPLFLDPLAASDSFGALAEAAFDRLVELGREAFRQEAQPLISLPDDAAHTALLDESRTLLDSGCFEDAAQRLLVALSHRPSCAHARQLYARALVGRGLPDRALTYLLAALASREDDQNLWKELATTLWSLGRNAEALQAIETCVRMNQEELEPWLLFGEWAHRMGHQEMALEVLDLVQKLSPHDPRVELFAATVSV